jgi:CYTH domain-containing protein
MAYNVEIERKYLCNIDKVPFYLAVNVNQVRQFYLSAELRENMIMPSEIRVVVRNDKKAEITIKSTDSLEIRDEFSIPISVEDAYRL